MGCFRVLFFLSALGGLGRGVAGLERWLFFLPAKFTKSKSEKEKNSYTAVASVVSFLLFLFPRNRVRMGGCC